MKAGRMKAAKALAAAVAMACGALPALTSAQMRDPEFERGRAGSYSLIPFTSYGYVGLNLGTSKYDVPCVPGFDCDDNAFAGKFYTGGLFSRIIGAQIGYVHMNEVERGSGRVQARGVNVSLVGNVPLDAFNVFGKIGTTYGWTETRLPPGFGLRSGDDDGFGLSYGLGVGFSLTPSWSVVGEWDREEFRFINGKNDVDLYTVGIRFKF